MAVKIEAVQILETSKEMAPKIQPTEEIELETKTPSKDGEATEKKDDSGSSQQRKKHHKRGDRKKTARKEGGNAKEGKEEVGLEMIKREKHKQIVLEVATRCHLAGAEAQD